MTKIKMYCIFSAEAIKLMKGNRGKLAAQAGHAYLHSYWNSRDYYPDAAIDYRGTDHAYKICLVVDAEDELVELQNQYREVCGTALIKDAGFTVFEQPTVTCLGLGPIREEDIGEDLKGLKLLI